MHTYTEEQVRALIALVPLLDIPTYKETTIGDIEYFLRNKLLAEYGTKENSKEKFVFPITSEKKSNQRKPPKN